jgi:hypothetical protein
MRAIQVLTLAVSFVVFANLSFAQPSPALRDIREIAVVVTSSVSEPNGFDLNPAGLKSRVTAGLVDAGFKVIEPPNPFLNVPELRIGLDMLKLEPCGQCVIIVRTSLSRPVNLMDQDEILYYGADVWKAESGLHSVVADNVSEEVNAFVQQQVQAFIAACPPMVSMEKKPDINQPRPQSRKANVEKNTNLVKQQAVEPKYVASKNSKVFHKADCPSARNIKPENLIPYSSREEAIAAGKKPCERCNP